MKRLFEEYLVWDDLPEEILPALEGAATGSADTFLIRYKLNATKDAELWKKVSEAVKKMARQRSAELVGMRYQADGSLVENPNAEWSITQTTRDNLNEMASSAIEEGWTVAQLQHQIVRSEDFSASRALMIARTEKAYAMAHGEHEAAKGVGMKYKGWIASEGCCEICQANEDAGRIPIDEPFPSGDDCVPCHPHDECANGYYESEEGED